MPSQTTLLLEKKYRGAIQPHKLACECGWIGDKARNVKFKKVTFTDLCPNCGEKTYLNAHYTFWLTYNK